MVLCKKICFHKYHGRGNDFVLIDLQDHDTNFSSKIILYLCDRNFGIGADGVILLQKIKDHNFAMRIYNSDGKEADSCGNALFCVARYIYGNNLAKKDAQIQLKKSCCHVLQKEKNKFQLCLEEPYWKKRQIPLSIAKEQYYIDWIHAGVDHAVVYCENIDTFPVMKIGKYLREHEMFSPDGVNVNFVSILSDRSLFVRTFEKGVEKETCSCTTGALAVAYSFQHKDLKNVGPIEVKNKKGKIDIFFDEKKKKVHIEGSATYVFSGCIKVENI